MTIRKSWRLYPNGSYYGGPRGQIFAIDAVASLRAAYEVALAGDLAPSVTMVTVTERPNRSPLRLEYIVHIERVGTDLSNVSLDDMASSLDGTDRPMAPVAADPNSDKRHPYYLTWDAEDYGTVVSWRWWEERITIDRYGDELTWESAEDFWAREVRVGGGVESYGMRFAESDAELAEAKIHFDLRVRETKRGLSEWRDDTFWDGERPTEEVS